MSLERLKLAAVRLEPVDPALASWLSEAVADLRVGIPPAEALDLTADSARPRRDAAIRHAAEMIDGSDWHKAGRIVDWLDHIDRCKWGEAEPTDHPIEDALRHAAGFGLTMPTSQRQVHRILQG